MKPSFKRKAILYLMVTPIVFGVTAFILINSNTVKPGSMLMIFTAWTVLFVIVATAVCANLLRIIDGEARHFEKTLQRLLEEDITGAWEAVEEDKPVIIGANFRGLINKYLESYNNLTRLKNEIEGAMEVRSEEIRTAMAHIARSEKLTSIGTLAAGFAHEVNNPLGIISSRIFCILDEYKDGKLPPGLVRDLEVIREQSESIGEISKKLLGFARESSYEYSPVDVNRVVEDALALLEGRMTKKNITVETNIERDLPPTWGNYHHLQHVIIDILNNSIDAVNQGGNIQIRSCRRHPGWGKIQIEISDDGMGIDQDDMIHIFDPFFTTKEPGEGTGLGLSISYAIIEDHKGKIAIQSEPGAGTTVHITLPASNFDSRGERLWGYSK